MKLGTLSLHSIIAPSKGHQISDTPRVTNLLQSESGLLELKNGLPGFSEKSSFTIFQTSFVKKRFFIFRKEILRLSINDFDWITPPHHTNDFRFDVPQELNWYSRNLINFKPHAESIKSNCTLNTVSESLHL